MISLDDAITDIVMPAVRAVFNDGEVTTVSVRLDPDRAGGSLVLTLTAVGETFSDLVVQGNIEGMGVADWRERLRSDMADFVSESRFGWGQNRGV